MESCSDRRQFIVFVCVLSVSVLGFVVQYNPDIGDITFSFNNQQQQQNHRQHYQQHLQQSSTSYVDEKEEEDKNVMTEDELAELCKDVLPTPKPTDGLDLSVASVFLLQYRLEQSVIIKDPVVVATASDTDVRNRTDLEKDFVIENEVRLREMGFEFGSVSKFVCYNERSVLVRVKLPIGWSSTYCDEDNGSYPPEYVLDDQGRIRMSTTAKTAFYDPWAYTHWAETTEDGNFETIEEMVARRRKQRIDDWRKKCSKIYEERYNNKFKDYDYNWQMSRCFINNPIVYFGDIVTKNYDWDDIHYAHQMFVEAEVVKLHYDLFKKLNFKHMPSREQLTEDDRIHVASLFYPDDDSYSALYRNCHKRGRDPGPVAKCNWHVVNNVDLASQDLYDYTGSLILRNYYSFHDDRILITSKVFSGEKEFMYQSPSCVCYKHDHGQTPATH